LKDNVVDLIARMDPVTRREAERAAHESRQERIASLLAAARARRSDDRANDE